MGLVCEGVITELLISDRYQRDSLNVASQVDHFTPRATLVDTEREIEILSFDVREVLLSHGLSTLDQAGHDVRVTLPRRKQCVKDGIRVVDPRTLKENRDQVSIQLIDSLVEERQLLAVDGRLHGRHKVVDDLHVWLVVVSGGRDSVCDRLHDA